MHQQETLKLRTNGPGLYEFTNLAHQFVTQTTKTNGPALLTVYVRHTSCSLIIQENADPDVQVDLNAFFSRLVPTADEASMSYLVHRSEGPDDMPAHIKAALTQTSISIPINNREMCLGTWQGIYLFEHRFAAHTREIVLHLSE